MGESILERINRVTHVPSEGPHHPPFEEEIADALKRAQTARFDMGHPGSRDLAFAAVGRMRRERSGYVTEVLNLLRGRGGNGGKPEYSREENTADPLPDALDVFGDGMSRFDDSL